MQSMLPTLLPPLLPWMMVMPPRQLPKTCPHCRRQCLHDTDVVFKLTPAPPTSTFLGAASAAHATEIADKGAVQAADYTGASQRAKIIVVAHAAIYRSPKEALPTQPDMHLSLQLSLCLNLQRTTGSLQAIPRKLTLSPLPLIILVSSLQSIRPYSTTMLVFWLCTLPKQDLLRAQPTQ
ncbi:hypothetical protein L7F22_040285 [Adiantum nelumboides]|nr:hypothetical protein [Adiantum nelumboides]